MNQELIRKFPLVRRTPYMIGVTNLTSRQREVLLELANHTCEQCKKHKPECGLDIHRMVRGEHGGTYLPRNVKVLCNNCHKLIS